MSELQQDPMAKPEPTDAEYKRETSDRLRRMETRLTRFMEWSGFNTETRKPVFHRAERGHNAVLDIPTDATSIRDCLAALSPDFRWPVDLRHKGQYIATITPWPPQDSSA